jgi:ppGpp synthetase/RelA/SpoT-type nucleotidyltranferase
VFANRLKSLFEDLLEAEEIDCLLFDARAKKRSSFAEKLDRKPGQYADPLRDMTDLAGVRIVAYYLSDVDRIGAVIAREFIVDADNSSRRSQSDDPEHFGYRSDHYIVSCSAERCELSEWERFTGLKAEIQVRTVLQHAWADIDHKLAYKSAVAIPREFRHQLSRISALLEVADEQFEAVRSTSEHLQANYDEKARQGDLDLPIDASSIHAYIAESDRVRQLIELARAAGFTILDNPRRTEVDLLAQACQAAALANLAGLDSELARSESWAKSALDALWAHRPLGADWSMPPAFLLACMIWMDSAQSLDDLEASGKAHDLVIAALRAGSDVAQGPE